MHEAGDRYRFDDASADWALLADLHRRSGRLLEAGEAARAGLELADSPFFRRLLDLQLRLAELCDTDAHLYAEAVADEVLALLARHGGDQGMGGGSSRLFVVRGAPGERARRLQ